MTDIPATLKKIQDRNCMANGADPCIDVSHKGLNAECPIYAAQNDTITFKNELIPEATATIHFYSDGDKGGTELTDFCGLNTTPIVLAPGASPYPCRMVKNDTAADMSFQYEIEATGYQDLDPVIIIRPSAANMMEPPAFPVIPGSVGIIGALVAGLLIGFWIGRR